MKAEQQSIELAKRSDARAIADLSRDVIEQGLGWSWTAPRVLKALRDEATNVIVARRHPGWDDVAGFAIMKYGDDTAHMQLGFKEIGVRVSYYRGVEDAIRFEKSLIAE